MKKWMTALREWGCDVDGAMERMLDDEDFYEMCLTETVKDGAFERLGDALRAGNAAQGFDEAHCLKGLLSNLGLTPMYDLSVKIVEPLRVGNAQGLMGFYDELIADNEKLKGILAEG